MALVVQQGHIDGFSEAPILLALGAFTGVRVCFDPSDPSRHGGLH